jgi:DNA primase
MISEEKILEIRTRSSIVEVVSDYVTLKKTGRSYVGLCPFHGEKTPSFSVHEERGIFHCFGCGAGGNVFHFLMQYEKLPFPEAVERVAKRYGISIERSERRPGQDARRESLCRVNEKAAAHFHENLFNPTGRRGLDYLHARGIAAETARHFQLGFSVSGGSSLAGVFKREGLPLGDAVRLGLLKEAGSGFYREKFFDRLMFPIVNPGGQVAGFGGRVIGDGRPKYLNSDESPLFHKSSTLYGLFQARDAIRAADRVIVVEGYLDVIALWQAGVQDVVATLGTALTPDHVRVLSRYTKNVIALFDGDEAGRKAAARSFEIFVEGGLLGKSAFLPAGEDPDSFVRARGKDAMEKLLAAAVPLADYYFEFVQAQFGKELAGRSQTAQETARVLAKVRNAFECDLLVRRAVDIGVDETLLRRFVGTAGAPKTATSASAAIAKPGGNAAREDRAESSLVSLMARFPAVIERVEQNDEISTLLGPVWEPVARKIISQWRERGKVDVALLAQDVSPERASRISALMLEEGEIGESEAERMAADCLWRLQKKYLEDLKRERWQAIRRAEEEKNEKLVKERMLEWQEVVRKERHLEQERLAPRTQLR